MPYFREFSLFPVACVGVRGTKGLHELQGHQSINKAELFIYKAEDGAGAIVQWAGFAYS